jgi:WD40 repeat protein
VRPLAPPLQTAGDFQFALAFGPDGRILASAGEHGSGGAVRLWDARTGRPLGAPILRRFELTDVSFSPDGRTLAWSTGNGAVELWDVRRARRQGRPLDGGADAAFAVAFSPDDTMLASSDERGETETIRLWDAQTHTQLGPPLLVQSTRPDRVGGQRRVLRLSFSRDGATLASVEQGGNVRLWSVRNHRMLGEALKGHSLGTGIAFTADGRRLGGRLSHDP